MKRYIRSDTYVTKQELLNEDIQSLGDSLRDKSKVGFNDAIRYMNQPGSKLIVRYRPEYMYMTNPSDEGDGVVVNNSCFNKLVDYLHNNGFKRSKSKYGGEYTFEYTK